MKQEAEQIAREIALTGGAAVFTIGSGLSTVLEYIPPILGCMATLAGTVLSIMLAVKAYNDIRNSRAERRYREETIRDIEYRRDNNLPCRRCRDKEIAGK